MKILNLYAGIGGNRSLWGEEHEITAVEFDPNIAKIYQQLYPNDEVIVCDAQEYLLENFENYDFIWASPPCPSHSRIRKAGRFKKKKDGTVYEQNPPVFPDMSLYEVILFLKHYYEGSYCVENVIPFYEPLIPAQKLSRHLYWSDVDLGKKTFATIEGFSNGGKELAKNLNVDYSILVNVDKRKVLRNCVNPEIGKYILDKVIENRKEDV